MKKEKEGFKQFCKICKGKENEGYKEWKKWVENEVKDLDEDALENMIKRYEIKYNLKQNDKRLKENQLLDQIMPIITLALTIGVYEWGYTQNTIVGLTSILSQPSQDIGTIERLVQDILHIIPGMRDSMITLTFNVMGCIIFLCAAVHLVTNWLIKYDKKIEIYYAELICVLKDIRERTRCFAHCRGCREE